jgi:hypothetical protein
MRLALARTCAWTLLLAGWLALGSAGQSHSPLWANGLLPVTAWLAVTGLAMRLGRDVPVSSRALRLALAGLGMVVTVALWAAASGDAAALGVAALAWGVLVVAASRAVRLLRPRGVRPPPPVACAALGALLAWAAFGEPAAVAMLLPAALSLVLAALLPRVGEARGCRTGLFDCALPLASDFSWRDPAAWGVHAARWTMLPMMATLAVMAPWCGGEAGLAPAQWVGLHLAAMLLPPCALRLAGVRTVAPAWVSAVMVAGLLLPWALPGLRGLMAMSLCHSVAWGLAWLAALSVGRVARNERPRRGEALLPAAVALALGVALAQFGPAALETVHVALGLAAAAGAALVTWRASRWTLEKKP